jgi:hypothetical protein
LEPAHRRVDDRYRSEALGSTAHPKKREPVS